MEGIFYTTINLVQWSLPCSVRSLHRKTVTTQQKEFSRIICLKISNCGRSFLASVNHDSKLVHLWSLINKKSLHVVFCESIVGCVDFGSERSRNLLAIGLFNNKECTYKIKIESQLLYCNSSKLFFDVTSVLFIEIMY